MWSSPLTVAEIGWCKEECWSREWKYCGGDGDLINSLFLKCGCCCFATSGENNCGDLKDDVDVVLLLGKKVSGFKSPTINQIYKFIQMLKKV